MNGRKAKALRSKARAETIGLPERIYEKVRQNTRVVERRAFGIQLGNCTRRYYKRLVQHVAPLLRTTV